MSNSYHGFRVLWVYNTPGQARFRLLLYIVLVTVFIVCISGIFPLKLLFIAVPLGYIAMLISALFVVNTSGIVVYRFLCKPIHISWGDISYYGSIEKTTWFGKFTYVYFSKKQLITAPHEPMPHMTNSLIYLASQPKVRSVVEQFWDVKKLRSISVPSEKSSNRKYMAHIYTAFYFVCLFRILYIPTNDSLWIYAMIFPGIYIVVSVILMARKID